MKDSIKILFVEDVLRDAELIWRELAKNEIVFEKILVDNGKDYIAELKSFNPDLILSDFSLPQFNGKQALTIRNEICPFTPFILVTGSNNETIAVDCMKSGADDYILKDNLSRLAPAVRNSLHKTSLLSEKKKSEKELKESEEKFGHVIKNIGEGVGILDAKEIFVFANPAAEVIFGVGPGKLEGLSILRFLLPEGIELIRKQIVNRKNNKINSYEIEIILEDGIKKQLIVTATPKLDESGNFSGTFGIFRDISERKKAERTLHDLIDNNPISIQILDTEGFTLKVNQAFIKLFGSVPPPNYSMFSDIQLKEKGFAELLARIINGEVVQFPDIIFNPHDSIPELPDCLTWIKAIGFSLTDGNGKPEKIVLMHENITERKLAEEKVINERILLRSLIDNLPDHIFVKDLKGRKVISNAADFKDLGLQYEQQVIGKTDIELFPGQTGQRGYSDDLEVITSGKPIVAREEDFINSQGKKRWSLATKIPLFDKDGKVTGLVGIGHNITESKRAEEELIKAKEKAEEGDRLKTAFLHNISHEIRTPMNAIVGFCALLGEPGLDSQSQKDYIEVIMQSSNHLLAIITDIIDISNIEANIVKIASNEININSTLKSLCDQFHPAITGKNLQLICENKVPDSGAMIITDSTKLQQIITNLLSNAVKFTDKGSIKLGCEVKDKFLEFHVSDTGIGISEEHHDKIFDRFYQVQHSVSRLYEGTGLGLAISKAHAELMGGKIWLTSEPGIGTTFYFTIPYETQVKATSVTDEMKKTAEYVFLEKKTILIAEDIDSNFKLVQHFLSGANAEIIRAVNGEEAVEKCVSNNNIDLVLMDIKMPLMDGYTAVKLIRKTNPSIPIIAQTAYADDKSMAIESGCSGFISKPYDKKGLLKVIQEFI